MKQELAKGTKGEVYPIEKVWTEFEGSFNMLYFKGEQIAGMRTDTGEVYVYSTPYGSKRVITDFKAAAEIYADIMRGLLERLSK